MKEAGFCALVFEHYHAHATHQALSEGYFECYRRAHIIVCELRSHLRLNVENHIKCRMLVDKI